VATLRATQQTDTREVILDIAERLVQERGFNGFSYADIAADLGITKAALHYHFAGKAQLGEALISRYASRFDHALDGLDAARGTSFDRLQAYAGLYLGVLNDDRMCLCGMLAAEYHTLPDGMRRTVVDFFERNHGWLAGLLRSGQADGTIKFTGRPEHAAQMIVGTLEGAMLVARPFADANRFQAVADQLLGEFRAPPPSSRRNGQR
jgi:TetR/AcrR family transcriptional repressor of nem operon